MTLFKVLRINDFFSYFFCLNLIQMRYQLQQKQVSSQKMNLTLKQYLAKYQGSRICKTPKGDQNSSQNSQNDLQKIFYQKLSTLKLNLKKYLSDEKIYSFIQIQLDELKEIFNKNFVLFNSKLSRNGLEKSFMRSRILKTPKNEKKQSLEIPVMQITNGDLDDLRVSYNIMSQNINKMNIKVNTEPSQIRISYPQPTSDKKSKAIATQNLLIKTNKKMEENITVTPKKVHIIEYTSKITPKNSLHSKKHFSQPYQVVPLPPQLSKMTSCEDWICTTQISQGTQM